MLTRILTYLIRTWRRLTRTKAQRALLEKARNTQVLEGEIRFEDSNNNNN